MEDLVFSEVKTSVLIPGWVTLHLSTSLGLVVPQPPLCLTWCHHVGLVVDNPETVVLTSDPFRGPSLLVRKGDGNPETLLDIPWTLWTLRLRHAPSEGSLLDSITRVKTRPALHRSLLLLSPVTSTNRPEEGLRSDNSSGTCAQIYERRVDTGTWTTLQVLRVVTFSTLHPPSYLIFSFFLSLRLVGCPQSSDDPYNVCVDVV